MNQNDNFYLAEAFQQLKCLNEEAFDLSVDRGVVDELQSFVADDIEAPYEEEIIDVEADDEDELQDDYVGKVILRCSSCGTKLFKDIKDVILDDNSEFANVEEECPKCGGAFGFEVIGKVEPFDEDEFKEDEEKPEEEVEVKDDEFSEEEIHEAFREILSEGCKNEECDKDLDESCKNEEKCEEECGDKDLEEKCDESLTEEVEPAIKEETAAEDAVKLEDSEQEPIKEELELTGNESEDSNKLNCQGENPVKESVEEETTATELNEGIENLSMDTEDQHLEMTSDENGRVEIITEPKHEEEVKVEDEMIAPLDDEDKAEIEANVEGEAPVDDEFAAEDEFAIDDFEEESFNELGESFLKRVYENVNSFETTSVKQNEGKLTVEGLIKFNSGKEKSTSFVFENFKNTKRGKIISSGLNETFSKSNKAFLLKGTLTDKKFVSESLTYNYTAKSLNESNESEAVKVYGRAVRR